MKSLHASRCFRLALLICGVAVALFGIPKVTSAQGYSLVDDECFDALSFCDTEGVSAILASTNSVEIDTYVETDFLDLSGLENFNPEDPSSYDYVAAVEGDLYQNNSQEDSTFTIDYFGVGIAESRMSDPVTVGDVYTLIGYHGVQDPYGGVNFVGNTLVSVYTGPPHINSFSPTYGYVGTSGKITVQGYALYDPFSLTVNAQFGSGTGLMLKPESVSADGTQLILGYTIAAQNATTGAVNIVLSDRFGTSTSTQTFNVGDPPPVITSVVPSVWQAGTTNLPITISGSGFGSSPTVNISAAGVTYSVQSTSDTVISATVSVASNAPNETAVVSVQSNGYSESGFFAATSGESSSATYNAQVQATPAPLPQIYLYGQAISTTPGQSTPVVVGQLMALSATVSGKTIQNQNWQISALNSAVGGYTNAAGTGIPDVTGGCLQLIPGQSGQSGAQYCGTPVIMTNSTLYFYWTGQGVPTVTYGYIADDGSQNSATASFSVTGPTGITGTGTIGSVHTFNPFYMQLVTSVQPSLPGVTFQISSTPPTGNPGAYEWVQLINSDHERYIDLVGRHSCAPTTFVNDPNTSPLAELDTQYPYITGSSSNDAPRTGFLDLWGEVARNFSAIMYAMWTPNQNGSCNSSTNGGKPCTVPVPLGNFAWQFSADSINTSRPIPSGVGPTWFLSSQWETPNPLVFIGGVPYPTWQYTEGPDPLSGTVPFSCSLMH